MKIVRWEDGVIISSNAVGKRKVASVFLPPEVQSERFTSPALKTRAIRELLQIRKNSHVACRDQNDETLETGRFTCTKQMMHVRYSKGGFIY